MAIKFAKMDSRVYDLRNISFVHFHEWIKDIAVWTNNTEEYGDWSSKETQSSPEKLKVMSKKLKNWIENIFFYSISLL